MSKRVTIRKLAAELELAPSTIYRALSGHPNVSQETRQKVMEASHKQGYLLPQHETANVAIIVPFFSFGGYLECLLPCLEEEFHRHDFRVLLVSEADIPLLSNYPLAGIISLVWKEGLEKLLPKSFSIPTIILNGSPNKLEHIPTIMSDPKGIRQALEYLRGRGCRRIFFVSPFTEKTPDAAKRLEEFRQFCLDTGQDYESLYMKVTWRGIAKKFPMIVNANPDACFCASESYAIEVGRLLKEFGKRIPEDISLMGLEDFHGNACFLPPITAIRQNFEQIAAMAAEQIATASQTKKTPQGGLVPFTLIERQSVRKPNR